MKTVVTEHTLARTGGELLRAVERIQRKIALRLEQKGPGLFVDLHQCYGVMAEELNKEFLDAVHANDDEQALIEAIDVAVAAIWTVASIQSQMGLGDEA